MASKDQIFQHYSDEAIIDGEKNSKDKENGSSGLKMDAVEWDKNHQQQTRKLNVFERNYQYARIYENKRCALKAAKDAKDADAISQRHFKASPMLIVNPPPKTHHVPKFTVPGTPEVLKRMPRT